MRFITVVALSLLSTQVGSAQSGDVDRCCMRAATQKGHTGQAAACYASVCKRYVTMKPEGGCSTSGKAFKAYQADLQATCNIGH